MTPLSSAEATQAVDIALSDSLVQSILNGRTYTTTAATWHANDFSLIGAGLHIMIDPPGDFEEAWPYIEADEDGLPQYPGSTDTLSVTGMADFLVLVDLQEEEVVSVSPGYTGTITGTPQPRLDE
jgi:hypothetical protein